MMEITMKWLREHGACPEGIDWFKEYQGGTEIDKVIKALCSGHIDWASWLAEVANWTGFVGGTHPNGHRYEEYFADGKLHRTDGPARVGVQSDGYRYEEYFVNGERVPKKDIAALERIS